MVYHVLNRANFRSRLFRKPSSLSSFSGHREGEHESRAHAHSGLLPDAESLALVLYPRADGDLSQFLQRVTMTHTQRYHAKSQTVGYGHVYQGRYKSLPVESGGHFLTLVRYVERNAKRAGLVQKAEDWPWSSVHVRLYGKAEQKKLLSPWPVPEPAGLFKVAEAVARERRNRENPPGDQEEPAVWFGEMGVKSGSAVRVGKHHAQPWEA